MPPTKSKKSKVNIQAFINWMWTELKIVDQQVKDDQALAAADMYRFLLWGGNAIEHAAYQRALKLHIEAAKQWLEAKKTAEELLNHLTINLVSRATVYSLPSGNMGRIMEAVEKQANAKICNALREAVKYNTFE